MSSLPGRIEVSTHTRVPAMLAEGEGRELESSRGSTGRAGACADGRLARLSVNVDLLQKLWPVRGAEEDHSCSAEVGCR